MNLNPNIIVKDRMNTYVINDVDRGLADNPRRPVISREPKVLNKRIEQTRLEIEKWINQISKGQQINRNFTPPKKMVAELNRQIGKLYTFVMQRIRSGEMIGSDEFNKLLKQASDIQTLPFQSDISGVQKSESIMRELFDRHEKSLSWVLNRLKTNNNPIWQKEALRITEDLQHVGINKLPEVEEVLSYIEKYRIKKPNILNEIMRDSDIPQVDFTKSYKGIQKGNV